MQAQARAHRKYSPSRSEQFGACPGMPNLVERLGITRDESEYAVEGTKAHDIFATALQEGVRDAHVAHTEYSSLCMEDFDDEFFRSIQSALDHVYGIMDDWCADGQGECQLFVEVYVNPPCDAAPGETGGYCDVAIHCYHLESDYHELYVIDYKHGAGIAKEALNNSQPMQYTGGFLFDESSPIPREYVDLFDEIIIQIIQPRAFHASGEDVREWRVTPYQIYEYITTTLEDRVVAAMQPDAPLIPGKAQCQFCEARTVCPAREAMVAGVLVPGTEIVKPFALPDVTTLDLTRLGMLWDMKGAIKKWFEDIDDHIKELTRHGHVVPGTKVVEADPRRTWPDDIDEIAPQLAALIGVPTKDVIQKKLIGITDAEKRVVAAYKSRVSSAADKKAAATAAKNAMAQLTDKKSSGNLVVVAEGDPRPPVNRATQFAQIAVAAQKIENR